MRHTDDINVRVSELEHYYGLDHLHYLTSCTYRRARLSESADWRRGQFCNARRGRMG